MVHQRPSINYTALKLLQKWMIGREDIRVQRELGQPAPWTTDKFLRDYRYCNVRREHDTNSKWIIDNIANSDQTLDVRIMNVLGARMYNNINTMENYFPLSATKINQMDNLTSGYLCSAYMPVNHQYCAGYWAEKLNKSNAKTPNGKAAYIRPSNLARLVAEWLYDGTIHAIIALKGCDEDLLTYLQTLPTMGEFMAYQHYVDLTYILDMELDENRAVISGPGCTMGLQCLFAEELTPDYRNANNTPNLKFKSNWGDIKTPEGLLYFLQENFDEIFDDWPYDWEPTVMCLENVMCEFHKYLKLNMGWGKPRKKYEAPSHSLFN